MPARSSHDAFDNEKFLSDLEAVRRRHGALAITCHVMVPLDARNHHVLKAETGVDQLSIDQVNLAARRPRELAQVPGTVPA